MRKIEKGNNSLRRGISTAVTAVIIVILVIAVGAGVYFYTSSTVSPTTSTATSVSTSTATSVSTVTAKTTQAPVTITVWQTYASGSTEFAAFNKSLAAFEAAYPYITVDIETHVFQSLPADYETASLAGNAPTVLRASSDWTGSLVEEGDLQPIDGFVNSTFLGQYIPTAIGDFQYKGHTWGLPENINGLALVYNKALVPNPPTTTDQLITMAQSITKTDSTGKITTAGIVWPTNGAYWWFGFINGFGGSVFTTKGTTVTPAINSSSAVASVQFINSLITGQGLPNNMPVTPPGLDETTAISLFSTGHAGMIIEGPWDNGAWKKAGINFGVAALPTVPSTGNSIAPFVGSQGWVISAGKPAAETAAAFKFIAWFSNVSSQRNLVEAGDLPSNAALLSDPLITGNATDIGFLNQAKSGQAFPNTPLMGALWGPVGTALSTAEPSAATTTITAAQIQSALDTAEASALRTIGSL